MNGRLPALLGVALLASGCLGVLGPEPAPLPPEDEAFTVVNQGCGLQLVEHTWVWVTYPDGTLYHFTVAVESNRTDEDGREDPEDRRRGDVNVTYDEAMRVLGDASATGAIDLDHYLERSRENGYDRLDLWHAEVVELGDNAFRDLRKAVTRADLGDRQARYDEPHDVSDGCGFDLVAWTPDGYARVERTTMNGPEEVKALDEVHRDLHPLP